MPPVADLGSGYRTAARISRPWSVAQAATRRPNGPGLGDHETGPKELVSCDVVAEAAVDEQVGDVPAQHLAPPRIDRPHGAGRGELTSSAVGT